MMVTGILDCLLAVAGQPDPNGVPVHALVAPGICAIDWLDLYPIGAKLVGASHSLSVML